MMPTRFRTPLMWALSAALLLGSVACASTGAPSGSPMDANAISAAELEENNNVDVLTLIQRLRPRWLQTRGSMSFSGQTPATVIVDGVPRGYPEYLRGIRVLDVSELTYMRAADATTRYGTDMTGGAILVTTKR